MPWSLIKVDHSSLHAIGSILGGELLAAASTNDGRVALLSYDFDRQLESKGEFHRPQPSEMLMNRQTYTIPTPIMGPELSLIYDGHLVMER